LIIPLEISDLIHQTLTTLKKDKVKKASVLYFTMILGIIAGIILSMLNTRMLSKELYGDFKFVQNIFTFSQMFLTIGLFYSGGRIIAFTHDPEKKREFYGTVFLFTAVISLALMILTGIFSLFEGMIFHNNLKRVIMACLPLIFVFPLQLCMEQLLQGDYKIYSLSFIRLAPKVLNILILLALYTFFEYKLILNLEVFLLSMALPMLGIVFWIKPKFTNLKANSLVLWKENKYYGFPVFIGAMAGVASAQIASFSISFFVDNANVGFFALAITATMPLAMLPVSLGTTLFKDFVSLPKIPAKVTLYTLIIGISVLVLFMLCIRFLVQWLYPPEFAPVVNLCYYAAIGSTFHGFGDFINRFISAKGKGRILRNSNFILGIINITGYTLFVYIWGIKGAAVTKLISGLAYMLNMLYFYIIIVKTENDKR
jgi:O-antigen/teichoic acid export membrane protein